MSAESLPKKFQYQTGYVALGKLARVLATLRNLQLHTMKVSLSSPDQDLIHELSGNFKKKYTPSSKRLSFPSPLLSKHHISVSELKERRVKKIMDLQGYVPSMIFVNEYRKELENLGEEFDIGLIMEGNNICMYSNNQISSIFESQILSIKKKLKCVYLSNPELFEKIKISRIIKDELLKRGIKYILLENSKTIVLHSSTLTQDQLKATSNLFAYDAMILIFSCQLFSNKVNRTYFRMLRSHFEPILKKIENNYEIKCEVNEKKMGFIIHTMDPIFSKEPKEQLTKYLSNITFITYFTKNPSLHLPHIRNNKPKEDCLQVMISDIFVYLSWDKNKQILPSQVSQVFSKLFQQVSEQTNIRVGFNPGGLDLGLLDHVQQIAHLNKLTCDFPSYEDRNCDIVKIGFKSYNALKKQEKIQQLNSFLQELITGKTNKSDLNLQKILTSPTKHENQLLVEKASADSVKQSKGNTKENSNTQENEENKPNQFIQSAVKGLQISIKTIENGLKGIINFSSRKRNRTIEQLLLDKYGIDCRVWNMNSPNQLEIEGQPEIIDIFAFSKIQRDSDYQIKQTDLLSFLNVKENQSYFLVSSIRPQKQFTISHEMMVYSTR